MLLIPATLFKRITLGKRSPATETGVPLTLSVYIGWTLYWEVVRGNMLTLLKRSFSPTLGTVWGVALSYGKYFP